jgi:hypothetical protein
LLKNPRTRPDTLLFKIFGKRGTFAPPDDASEIVGTVGLDDPVVPTGQCGEAPFPTAGCDPNRSGTKLTCSQPG